MERHRLGLRDAERSKCRHAGSGLAILDNAEKSFVRHLLDVFPVDDIGAALTAAAVQPVTCGAGRGKDALAFDKAACGSRLRVALLSVRSNRRKYLPKQDQQHRQSDKCVGHFDSLPCGHSPAPQSIYMYTTMQSK